IADLEAAARLDRGTDGDSQALLVTTLLRSGRGAEALAAAEQLVGARPDDPRAYNLRGAARLGLREFVAARRDFSLALTKDPDSVAARSNLATALIELGEPEAARETLESALVVNPGHQQTLLLLARLTADEGDADRA